MAGTLESDALGSERHLGEQPDGIVLTPRRLVRPFFFAHLKSGQYPVDSNINASASG